MIDDPDDPGYRYPAPGELLWHAPSRSWVTVQMGGPGLIVLGEVAATRGRQELVVKLKSLEVAP